MKPTKSRHNYIRQNKVNFIPFQKLNSFFPVGSLVYLIALCTQEEGDVLANV